jgi:hypothetical protein
MMMNVEPPRCSSLTSQPNFPQSDFPIRAIVSELLVPLQLPEIQLKLRVSYFTHAIVDVLYQQSAITSLSNDHFFNLLEQCLINHNLLTK